MHKITLVYDGDCPFCARYAALLRFKKAAGDVTMINAREHPEVVSELQSKGINIDKGMALTVDDRIYHGSDALHQVALMSSRSTLFNQFTAAVFKSKVLSKIFYPVLKAARRVALFVTGHGKINPAP